MSEKLVQLTCKGRGFKGEEVLGEGVPVTISVRGVLGKVSTDPENCPYNTGGHRDWCKAAHPDRDKVNNRVSCVYSFDYPYVLGNTPDWRPPKELVIALKEWIPELE